MVNKKVEAKSKVTRERGLHLNPKEWEGYWKFRKLFDPEKIAYYIFSNENNDLKVLMRGLSVFSVPGKISKDSKSQGIDTENAETNITFTFNKISGNRREEIQRVRTRP